MENPIDLKAFKIYLPDGDRRSFYIYGDWGKLFGTKFQADAAKKIRNSIKELDYKPLPSVEHQGNATGITTRNPEIIFKIILKLNELSLTNTLELSEQELNDIHQKLISWKAPKAQKWKVGDIFSLKLMDNSYVFGQIIGDYPTIALFNYKNETDQISFSELAEKQIVTILHFTSNNLSNWKLKVIGDYPLLADKDSGPTNSDKLRIGHRSFGSNVLESICNYHWFKISKWTNENDFKELIMI